MDPQTYMKPTKKKLEAYYLQQKLGCIRIARREGVTKTTVLRWLKSEGIKIRTGAEKNKYKRKDILKCGGRILKQRGYIDRWNSDLQKYEPEHRAVWEEHNGKIPPDHEIHHINGVKTDNRIVNLSVVHKTEHRRKYHKSQLPDRTGMKHTKKTKKAISETMKRVRRENGWSTQKKHK